MKLLLLFRNIRFYILLFSILTSVFFYIYYQINPNPNYTLTYNLLRAYALSAVFFLYLALLIGPFCYNFKTPYNSLIIKSRRAIGVSAFYFALLHVYLALFFELGGLIGILALDPIYRFAISLSTISFIILFSMAMTSFDFMIKFMTFKKWKLLHRLVYIGAFFTLVHALILGSHFKNFNYISLISIALLVFLFFLEGKRIFSNLKTSSSKK